MSSCIKEMFEELDQKKCLVEYLEDYDEDAMEELLTKELGEDHPLIMAIVEGSCNPDGVTALSELLEVTITSLKAEVREHEVRIKHAKRGLKLKKQ